jgi:DNA-binding GntR family transcriptional regulator
MAHSTLAENVAHTLRHAIQFGEYLSGERLVELTLAHELAVSQNTVRDALRILEQQGWVVKQARRGVFVKTFTKEEVEEIYTLWATPESLALVWAMRQMTPAHLDFLAKPLEDVQQHIELGNWKGAQESAFRFHEALIYTAGKQQTAELLTRLLNAARLLENLRELRFPRGAQGWREEMEAYRRLHHRIAAGDLERARAALHELIMSDAAEVMLWL